MSFARSKGPKLSQICFADDRILVAEANRDQVNVIQNVMESFCDISGQKLKFSKSKVLFSNNTNDTDEATLSQGLGIEQTSNLGIYLGAPMLHQRNFKESDQFVFG